MPFTRAPADSVRITSNKTEQKVQRLQPHKVWIGECKRDFCNSGQDALIGAEAERLEYSPLVLKVPVEMRGFLFTLCSPPPSSKCVPDCLQLHRCRYRLVLWQPLRLWEQPLSFYALTYRVLVTLLVSEYFTVTVIAHTVAAYQIDISNILTGGTYLFTVTIIFINTSPW